MQSREYRRERTDFFGTLYKLSRRLDLTLVHRQHPSIAERIISRIAMAANEGVPVLFLGIFAFISLGSCEVSFDRQEVTVKQGENVSITCTTDEIKTNFDAVRLNRKKDGGEFAISDNAYIKSPFKETKRYHVTKKKGNDGEMMLTLHFIDIQGEDSGIIECYKLVRNPISIASVKITVLVPVKELYVSLKEAGSDSSVKFDPGALITLEESKGGALSCVAVVNGSDVEPSIKVMIGDQDRTLDFAPKVDHTTLDTVPELVSASSATVMEYNTMKPDWTFDGKNLTCSATMNGFKEISVSFPIEVLYAPVITCPKFEYWGKIDSPVKFSCDVYGNPDALVKWKWGENSPKKELESPGDKGRLKSTEVTVHDHHKRVTLEISKVHKVHLTTFILEASNDISTTEVSLTLQGSTNLRTTKPPYTLVTPQETRSNGNKALRMVGHILYLAMVGLLLAL